MKLGRWIELEGITLTQLAAELEEGIEQVRRWSVGISIPRPPAMRKLYLRTRGQVAPNDFYDLPELEAPIGAAA